MRMLVLFKVVPDLGDLAEADWAIGPDLRPEEGYARVVINPEDESALELALRLRDALGPGAASLAAATVGPGRALRVCQTLKALGFDEVRRVEPLFDERFRPELVGRLLVPDGEGLDLVLAGGRSADGQNGLTAMFVAERLGWPLVTEVLGLEVAGGGALRVESLSDDGLIVQTARPPLVLAVGNAPSAFLRVPTLRERLARGQGPVLSGEGQDGGERPLLAPLGLERAVSRRDGRLLDEGGPAEKARAILGSLREWGR
ncbi:MAG: hypothetical protein LBP92_12190 [Deltaproteobacteria bacterium]|jgi:electron transfer flavoprotein alpha/beta subunit|nr:hypothetical protein [Deltaproteobacteria bacterium]